MQSLSRGKGISIRFLDLRWRYLLCLAELDVGWRDVDAKQVRYRLQGMSLEVDFVLIPNLYKRVAGDELNLQRLKKVIKTTPE